MRRVAVGCALLAGSALFTAPPTAATAAPTVSTPQPAVAAAATTTATATATTAATTAAGNTDRRVAFRPVTASLTGRPGAVGATIARAGRAQSLDTGVVAVPTGLAVIGATWAEGTGSGIRLSYREKRAGVWSAWKSVDVETCDDCASPSAPTRAGSAPVTITGATHVQARLVADTPVSDARLSVIDPADPGTTQAATPAATSGAAPAAAPVNGAVAAPLPAITASRGGLVSASPTLGVPGVRGARAASLPAAPQGLPGPRRMPAKREVWRATETDAAHQLDIVVPRGIVVHHTAGTNNYTRSQVPAILRGIQRFHTRDRGWSDIGYNVLVDRYGRVWEGRWGGIGLPHRGAHASGVNQTYLGVSYIGDTSARKASAAGVRAIVDVVAWTSVRYGFDVGDTMRVNSRTAPVVPGHYQVGNTPTSCPGVDLRRRLPEIRERAERLAQEYRDETAANVARGTE
ncbi:N-acetylmuramoyl-L-alanine amidase [Mobilicoccus massiliensis]|uniref:N-acetylmuramoyl-L-alanine amidase n=1 Tax=Mobilicoccus massiliensis TaxID=1522310 RepID=UPI0011431CB0|nr:N-acetylmuramoyl-L-alanine amidase [Mobilicoccus massiliensis]